MPADIVDESYEFISGKIQSLKGQYHFLQDKSDDYAFSALCIKNSIYKNPALYLSEDVLKNAMVDGTRDGGVDFVLLDPNNHDASDLIIGQAKYYKEVSLQDAKDAIHKMIDFYNSMMDSNYENVREDVVRRFTTLYAEVGEESKVKFQLFISAKKNNIRLPSLEKVFKERLDDENTFELQVFFGADIEEEIKEAESRRPCVESGKLLIDSTDNALYFRGKEGKEAAVVNISAKSLKKLYAQYNTSLLAKNLRYFLKGKSDVNTDVRDTIRNSPETFWFKNNGITIICDKFKIDGPELKLTNFSIVNGGQTTTLIYRSDLNERREDFFIVCKVIAAQGDNEDEKSQFVLDIAKATNSQKPIKSSDLKSNAREQISFANAMKEVGVFYKTKRGEDIPATYKIDYKNSDIADTGKLALAGLFQLPASSRNKPSTFYNDRFYNIIFNSNQMLVSKCVKNLLYIDFYFRNAFLTNFDRDHAGSSILTFAHNARTICISFVALASRIVQNNLSNFGAFIDKAGEERFYDSFYPKLKNFDSFNYIIKPEVFNGDKDELDSLLYKFFYKIIKEGFKCYNAAHEYDASLNETNYLKKDSNYFKILKHSWDDLNEVILENKQLFI